MDVFKGMDFGNCMTFLVRFPPFITALRCVPYVCTYLRICNCMTYVIPHRENRYLLFLTENDAALEIMQDYLVEALPKPPYVLFGSSFPKDKDYTQVMSICNHYCRIVVNYRLFKRVNCFKLVINK